MEVPAFMMGSQEQHDMRFREVCSEFRANLFSVSMKRDEALGLNLFCVWVKRAASLGWMCLVFLPNLMCVFRECVENPIGACCEVK